MVDLWSEEAGFELFSPNSFSIPIFFTIYALNLFMIFEHIPENDLLKLKPWYWWHTTGFFWKYLPIWSTYESINLSHWDKICKKVIWKRISVCVILWHKNTLVSNWISSLSLKYVRYFCVGRVSRLSNPITCFYVAVAAARCVCLCFNQR